MKSNVPVLFCLLLATAVTATAADGSMLKPSSRRTIVAVAVFGDLQRPSWAEAAPLLRQAARAYVRWCIREGCGKLRLMESSPPG